MVVVVVPYSVGELCQCVTTFSLLPASAVTRARAAAERARSRRFHSFPTRITQCSWVRYKFPLEP